MTTLIVDDDQVLADTLARAFARRGLESRCLYSLSDFEQYIVSDEVKSTPPRQAVIDLKIGDDSGLVIVKALASNYPQCKSLVLTGYSSIATAVEAIKMGAVNYLPKPANADEILHAIGSSGMLETTPLAPSPPSVDRLEWEHIQRVLMANEGNISATARALNMHRRTLQRKLQKRPVKE